MDSLLPPKEAIEKLLSGMSQLEASDLHLKVGYRPYYRVSGVLRATRMPSLPDNEYVEAMLHDLIPEARRREYDELGAIDFATRGAGGDRYRINVFRSTGDTHASIHRVHSQILSYESLNLPEVYQQTITRYVEGLILVSGVSGSGKSSTLAAMVEQINQTRSVHIITIEDPIEFTFTPRRSIISQREIGIDVPNYREALRYLARQDPDCIVMGEMRDREIMLAALEAAETGHLVLGSLPLADVQQTFARFLESFPPSDHAFVRTSLANNLRAIMCQRLVPGMDEGTYWPATEVLLRNPAVKDRILHEKGEDLASVIAQHEGEGMRSFTTSLCELIKAEKVHYDTAMDCAPYPEALDAAVKGIKTEQ